MNSWRLQNLMFRFLCWFCPDQLYEEIEGDLIQKFNRDVKTFGEKRAKSRLIWNVVRFFRPGIILRNKFSLMKTHNLMLVNHTKVTLRHVSRNKVFSVINVLGLTIGLTVCLLVAQFVLFERSFDRSSEKADRTYRVNLYNTQNGIFDKISSMTVSGLAFHMEQSIVGIESIARLSSKTQGIVTNPANQHQDKEEEIVFADAAIVDVLALDFIEGSKKKILVDPNSVIISESTARKYFGDTPASGRMLSIGFNRNSLEGKSYRVQGVFQDIPLNAHQRFQFVLPPENGQAWDENWDWSDVYTYVILSSNANAMNFENGLSKIVKEHHTDKNGDRYLLEPITEIHLKALDGSGRAELVNLFILLAAIILSLACFNYINLSTARFFERMKEVGVRKLIGASRWQLIFQLLLESFFFCMVSFCLALILFFVSWRLVTQFLEQPIPITLLHSPILILAIVGFVIVVTICTGFYPALFLSSFNPLQSLKGKEARFADRSTLRKGLVIIQLSVSIVLITSVLAIQRQINFMQDQNLGISMDQTFVIDAPLLHDAATIQKFETFKNEVLQMPSVQGVTYASSFPGAEIDWHRSDITLGKENDDFHYDSRIIGIGAEFLDVFNLELLSGRNFRPQLESDMRTMIISEEACKMFGFANYNDALNKLVFIGSRRFEVIGVVKNYHYRSLQNQIQPLLYIQGYPRNPSYAIKIATDHTSETISAIEKKWKEAYTGNVFKYFFLKDFFDRQYSTDRQIGKIVFVLTLLAIFISFAGLFGLSLYSVNRRTKEIGIRKVLGATLSNIVILLSGDFIWLLMMGGILTIPLAYQVVKLWLERYAYKMQLDGWLFIIPFAAVSLLVLTTMSFQTIAAARRSPVDSIKYE